MSPVVLPLLNDAPSWVGWILLGMLVVFVVALFWKGGSE